MRDRSLSPAASTAAMRASSRRRFLGRLCAAGAAAALPRWSRTAEPAPRSLGVALVGLGSYSTSMLGPALQQTRRCHLAGVVTGDPDKGRRWAAQYGFPESNIYGYDTMGRLEANRDIDVVYVVTPNGLHAEHTLAAARAGKHVICEKPMAISVAECDAMIAACRQAGVGLSIGYRLHFEPHTLEYIRIARQREFGAMRRFDGAYAFTMGSTAAAYSAWRINRKLAGGGPLMDLGIYVIQAVCMGAAEAAPLAVTARFEPVTRPELFKQVEQALHWRMEYPDGVQGLGRASYNDSISHFRAEATHGWLDLGDSAFQYRGQQLLTSAGERDFPSIFQQVEQIDASVAAMAAGQPSPVPGAMGRRDLAIIEAIYASARADGKRITVTV